MSLFDGESYKAQYALIAYRLLLSREPVGYQDIVDEFYKECPSKKPKYYTDAEGYGELKKAFPGLIKAIRDKEGEEAIEEFGNNRKKAYRYVGKNPDPLAELTHLRTINSLKEFREFCKNTAGFIPQAWFDHFFKDTCQLVDIKADKKEGKVLVVSEIDRGLRNIELLPFLYEAIRNRKVLRIRYKHSEQEDILFHPHILKEYNGRWFLFGHAEGKQPEIGFNLALDRIIEEPKIEQAASQFYEAPAGFYTNYFKDIVGVTHDRNWPEIEEIIIRARNFRMFNLVNTKPFHHSQRIVKDYDFDNKYGEFKVNLKVNNEFIGKILQLGAGIEIISPANVRNLFKQRISNMLATYEGGGCLKIIRELRKSLSSLIK